MKITLLLLFLFVTGNMMVKAQEYNDETEEVLHLLNVTPGEKLTKGELQKRLKLGRILQHVYQGDSLVFNPENEEAIKVLPCKYVEYTRRYFDLFNHLLETLTPVQREMMKGFWDEYDITNCVMHKFLEHDTRYWHLSISKSEVLEMGVTEVEYDSITSLIAGINAIHATLDTVYMPEKNDPTFLHTIFFPDYVMMGLDRGAGIIYKRFQRAFLIMIENYKKQLRKER
ncbi:MAG: hypothetical protein ACLUDU_18470 [Butyricimonas faecihominis]